MRAEFEPSDGELLALAELTREVARSITDSATSRRLLVIADQVHAMAYRAQATSLDE